MSRTKLVPVIEPVYNPVFDNSGTNTSRILISTLKRWDTFGLDEWGSISTLSGLERNVLKKLRQILWGFGLSGVYLFWFKQDIEFEGPFAIISGDKILGGIFFYKNGRPFIGINLCNLNSYGDSILILLHELVHFLFGFRNSEHDTDEWYYSEELLHIYLQAMVEQWNNP